jgi:signal transduction histidine kinase
VAHLTVLDQALSREGDNFYDDVALTDEDEKFLGIITVPTLVQWQSRLILQKTQLAEQQRQALQENNQQLFRSLNQLRQSQGRFEILFENSALGVALMNTRGEVETGNHRLEILLGCEMNEMARAFDLSALVAPAERDNFLRLLREHEADAQETSPRNTEFLLSLPGRGPRRFKFFTSWIRETGQVCALIDDITEQRVLEHRLIQKEKSAMLDSLVGGIAHEINNKLAPIIGFSELLLGQLVRGQPPEKLTRYCSMIRESALDSAKIIRQLLQLSRPVTANLTACDIRELVREVVAFLGFRIRESACEIVLDLPPEKMLVRADATQMKQVIINLTLNALDALEPGRKRQVRYAVTGEENRIILKVADTGHGIKPENLQNIFDPFFTTKNPDRGSGLGLSVCVSILKQHGGEISARSVWTEGSEFEVALPRASESDLQFDAAKTDSPDGDEPVLENGHGSDRRRVLVVDDEEYITSMIQEALRNEMNCSVERVTNGLRAVARLEQADFDFVISDVRMPELDGFGLFEWLKENRSQLAEKFLFITGDAGSQDLNQKLESLGARVLRKPFKLEMLMRECQRMASVDKFAT